MAKKKASLAVQLGQPISGTKLVRRFQDGKQISPIYQPEPNEIGVPLNAQAEAARVNEWSVTVNDVTYVQMFGQWYTWSLPPQRE
jgi:hypothetical protein